MKVIKRFYCTKTNKKYDIGDEYEGTRKDIVHLLESKKRNKKAPITKKGAIKTK